MRREGGLVGTNLSEEERPLDINAHVDVEVLLGGVFQIFHRHDARVWDQDVDFTKTLDGFGHHMLNLGNAACIGFDGKSALISNLFDQRFRGTGVGGVVDGNIGTIFG